MAAYTYVDAPRTLQDCLKHLRDVIVAMDDSCVARRAWKLLAVEWPEADLASWLFPQAVPPQSQMFSGGAQGDSGGGRDIPGVFRKGSWCRADTCQLRLQRRVLGNAQAHARLDQGIRMAQCSQYPIYSGRALSPETSST